MASQARAAPMGTIGVVRYRGSTRPTMLAQQEQANSLCPPQPPCEVPGAWSGPKKNAFEGSITLESKILKKNTSGEATSLNITNVIAKIQLCGNNNQTNVAFLTKANEYQQFNL